MGFLAPIVVAHLSRRVPAACTRLLLVVKSSLPASGAQTVGFCVLFTHGRSAIAASAQEGHHVQGSALLNVASQDIAIHQGESAQCC